MTGILAEVLAGIRSIPAPTTGCPMRLGEGKDRPFDGAAPCFIDPRTLTALLTSPMDIAME